MKGNFTYIITLKERAMKKIFLSIFLCITVMLTVCAESMPNLKYKNIGNKDKISYSSENGWSKKIDKKTGNYYIKTKGFGSFYDYVDAEKRFAFSTNCEYEVLYNNRLIGYSSRDLKFYDMDYSNGVLTKQELSKEEVEQIFPDYKVVALSEFSPKTNSLKIKKHLGDLKIILFNDTDKTFDNFKFTSGNAKFEQYSLKGFLTVSKPGMIQFSRIGDKDRLLWYVLLVR